MIRLLLKFAATSHLVLLALVLPILTLLVSAETTIPLGNTVLTGRVLDAVDASHGTETPVVGATVSIQGTAISATTDSFGNFTLENIPTGGQVIYIDTSTSDIAPDGSAYASFTGWIPLNQGVVNNIESPFYLTRIDRDSITKVKSSKTTIVENPNLGVTLTILPKSAVNSDNGKLYKGEISISLIPQGFPPMPPPRELGFGLMVTIQPAGIIFTEPALITFPNIDNFPPDAQVEIMEPNINTGKFEVVGIGQVNDDGSVIETISGGIVKTGNCDGPAPPGPRGGPAMQDPPPCDDCCPTPTGSSTTLAGGNLIEEHALVSYKLLNQDRSLTFEYNSTFADPRPIIQNQVDLSFQAALGVIPDTTSMNLNVAGVDRGTVYTKVGQNGGLQHDGQIVQAMQFDAISLPTGVYPFDLWVTNNYTNTTRSILQLGEVIVNNLSDSAFGSGWGIEGLSRLYIQEDGSVLIDGGASDLLHFKSRSSTLTPPTAGGTQSGMALKFDGFDDYVTFPSNSGNIMKTLPLTVEAWVRPELRVEDPSNSIISKYGANHSTVVSNVVVTSGLGSVIEKGHGIGVNIFGHQSYITITRHHAQHSGTNDTGRRIITNPLLAPDTWYHVAVVYTNGSHKTYLNGELIDDSSYPQGNVASGGSLLRIGRIQHCCFIDDTFHLLHYKGYMDEVRIWQAARTQSEIQNTMSVQLSGNEAGLVYYAKIDEGQGQVITDSTSTGNNGTLGINTSVNNNDPQWMTYREYDRDTDGDFITPPGDYSALFENTDGTFTRKLKDGSQVNYNAQGLQISVVDRNGNTTTYQYDGQGRLTRITDSVGLVATLAYTGGRLSSVTDPTGRATVFQHDGAGNLIKITDPDETFRQFSYDSSHRMISQTSKRGFVTTYQYNSAGRNIGAIRPDGSVVTVSPQWMSALIDPSSGVGTQSNPAPLVRADQVTAKYTNGNGKTTTYKLNEFGSIKEITDALGRITVTTRDQNNNVTQSKDPRGNITNMTYDEKGNLLTSTNQSIGATTTFTYTNDGFNQVKTIKDPRNNTTTFNYDIKGNLTSIRDAMNNQTTMTYDSRGLLLSSTDALNNTVTFQYDPVKGNLVGTKDQLLNKTAFALDAVGNIRMRFDAEGQDTEFVYDSMNRLIRVIDPDLADTDYSYDSAGNLASVTDFMGGTTTFAYDPINRLTRRTDPLGNSETVAYDGNGNLISTTDRKNQTITFEYDAASQLTKKTLPGSLITTFTYDASGNRLTVNDPDSKLTLTYDGANRLKSVATTGSPNQPGVTINYTYDLSGNRITLSSTPSGTTNYVYDALNRLTSLANSASQTVGFSYDTLSRRTKTTFPNGVITDYFYDAKSQLLSLVNRLGTTNISAFDYTYDTVGNRTGMGTTRAGVSVNNNLSYEYDNLYRLIEATNPLPGQFDEMFSYDPVGNRLRRNGQTTDAVFKSANHLIEDQGFTYAYDNNGNLVQKTNKSTSEVTQYTYDVENHLTQVSKPGMTATYHYDGLGRRIEKNVNGAITRYVYDNQDILLEYNGSNALTTLLYPRLRPL